MRPRRPTLSILSAALLAVAAAASGCAERDRARATLPHSPDAGGAEAGLFAQQELARDLAAFGDDVPGDGTPEDRGYDARGYEVDGAFDWDALVFTAQTTITLVATAPELDSVVLDSRVTRIDAVRLADGRPLAYATDEARGLLTVQMPEALAQGQEARLIVSYRVDANDRGIASLGSSGALRAVPARAGDPVAAKVFFTHSEPRRASRWMPCHNHPADRATFAFRLRVPADQSVVANGDLVEDSIKDGVRTVAYRTSYSLPTYLMAFAGGELQTAEVRHGSLPVSLWTRRGLAADEAGVLSELVRMLGTFERLLGDYPFEKYALVLLPEMNGGIEHAGISFQGEAASTRGDLWSDHLLSSHELAHQWFGDYVTVRGWDDLWIKEGMATLLSYEAARVFEDRHGTGRLFGSIPSVRDGDAVRDPGLAPEAKYTSGPYGRASWLLTQLRKEIGEARFWGGMRRLLADNAFGTVDTTDVVDEFGPALGSDGKERLLRALAARRLPEVTAALAGDGRGATLSVADPDGALLSPIEVRVHTATGAGAGAVRSLPLTAGAPVQAALADGQRLGLDASDVHPLASLPGGGGPGVWIDALAPLLTPAADGWRTFLAMTPSEQQWALLRGQGWTMAPAQLPEALEQLGSQRVKALTIGRACAVAVETGAGDATLKAQWQDALWSHATLPPTLVASRYEFTPLLSHCGAAGLTTAYASDYARIERAPHASMVDESLLMYLAHFPLPADKALRVWGSLAEGAPNVRSRMVAQMALLQYVRAYERFAQPTAAELPAWRAHMRGILASSRAAEVLRPTVAALVALRDPEALAPLADLALDATDAFLGRLAVCSAYKISAGVEGGWDTVLTRLGPAAGLPLHLRVPLADPVVECP